MVLAKYLEAFTDDEQRVVSTCLWSSIESRMRTSSDLAMDHVLAIKAKEKKARGLLPHEGVGK